MKGGVCHTALPPASAPWWPSVHLPACLVQASAVGRMSCQAALLLVMRLLNANLLLQDVIVEKTTEEGVGGVDYSFECIGSVEVWHAENCPFGLQLADRALPLPHNLSEQPRQIYQASPPTTMPGRLQRHSTESGEPCTRTMASLSHCPVCR